MFNFQLWGNLLSFTGHSTGAAFGFFPSVWTIQYNLNLLALRKHKQMTSDATEQAVADGPEVTGLKVEYHLLPDRIEKLSQADFGTDAVAAGMVDDLDYYRTRDAFWDGGAINKFAARYTGKLNVTEGGSYKLFLTTDEIGALYIDGKRVINNKVEGENGLREGVKTIDLTAGSHDIEIRYVENRGSQTLQLDWQGPDSDGIRTKIGGDKLTHHMADHDMGGHMDDDDHMAGDGHDGHGMDDDGMSSAEAPDGQIDGDQMSGDDQGGHDMGGDMDGHDHDGHDMGDDMAGDGHEDHDHGMGDNDMAGEDHGDHDMGDHDGHDHGMSDDMAHIPLPTHPGEVEAYVVAVKAQADHSAHMHQDDAQKATEHGQLLDLVPRAEATHIAIGHGDWFDPDTWYNGEIPGEGAKVLIPGGVSVTYDGESDASLFTVRVDGELSFATDKDTKMVVDTMIVDPSGRLEIGTEDNPVQDHVDAQIIIANNGDIDVGWDPSLLSRGVISHGQVEIHGAEKTAYLKVAEAPMAGDKTIELAEIPDNWQVGDTIVLTGTHKQGWYYSRITGQREFAESQDEEVTITAIEGNTLRIDRPLSFDHDVPREDLAAYVANTSRNITFASEDGEASAVHHRGHVMFMHNDDVDVRYAAFDDLGRTDKSNPAFHDSALDPADINAETNVQGRYSLHFHRTGTDDQENPAIAMGNAVNGSPGWGYVHHSSHANFSQNVAFDVFGAAFVAEDGDETGVWWQNMAIKTEGIGYGHAKTKSGADVNRDDVGRTGDGFFFGGRMVEAGENIAANTTHGYVWMTRTSTANPLADHTDQPDAFYGKDTARSNAQVPIQGFSDNEAFGTQVGLIVVKRMITQNHDVRTVMDGFLNWETTDGVQLTYTSHYTMKNFDLIGTDNPLPSSVADDGFDFGAQVFDIVVNGLTVENFKTGVNLNQRVKSFWTDEDIDHVLIDVDLIGNEVEIEGFDPARHTLLTADDLVQGQLGFRMTGDTVLDLREGLIFNGIKTDSIGDRDRQFASDEQSIGFKKNILAILQDDGFYKTEDGRNVILVNDLVADRATGELLKFSHVITLDTTEKQLIKLGGFLNGVLDLDSEAPEAADDHVTLDNESSIIIDVLANDFDPDGDVLHVDGFTNPYKGDLSVLEDGRFLYKPHDDYVGTDTFDYWTADDQGQFTRATVTLDVFDLG